MFDQQVYQQFFFFFFFFFFFAFNANLGKPTQFVTVHIIFWINGFVDRCKICPEALISCNRVKGFFYIFLYFYCYGCQLSTIMTVRSITDENKNELFQSEIFSTRFPFITKQMYT